MDALSYIGFMIVVVFASTGGYVWLRWGYCGVVAIWSRRRELDSEVQNEVERTVIR